MMTSHEYRGPHPLHDRIEALESALREAKYALERATTYQDLPEHHLALRRTTEAITNITKLLENNK